MNLVRVTPGDPHHDQALAQTREDFTHHMEAINGILEQGMENGAPLSSVMAVIVIALMQNETESRERLAALLALSIVKNIANEHRFDSSGFAKYVSDMAAGR